MRLSRLPGAGAVRILLAGAAVFSLAGNDSPAAVTVAVAPVTVDHHLHVHSPAIIRFLPRMCRSSFMPEGCSPAFATPYTIDDLLAQMDAAGIRGGALLSTGYLAETVFADQPDPDHAATLHAGNVFTEEAARSHPGRLMAFVSVNPITATALPELARWKGDAFVTGVKLHLTNSGVDLRNPDHVRRLAAVVRAAAASRFAIVIHMRSEREDYGARDVRIFLHDVLPAAGNATVQIAHASGWGGIDANTLDALGAFAAAIEARPSLRKHLFFDLAEVWDEKSDPVDMRRLTVLIRRIGLRQFLPASDWPFSSDLAPYYGKTYPRLPLTPAEWAVIRANVAPYVPERLRTGV